MRRLGAILTVPVLAAALIIHLPLSWVGAAFMPQNQNLRPVFTGTLWNGSIENLPRIGSVDINISALNLLRGRTGVQFSVVAPALRMRGSSTIKGLLTADLDGDAFGIADIDPRFAGLQGRYNLTVTDMLIRSTCLSGGGTASTDILQRNAAAMQWSGPALSGPIRCEDGDVVIVLSGEDTQQSVSADIRLKLSGQYRAIIDVTSRDSRAGAILPLFGFEATQTGFRLSEAGQWM